MSLRRVNFFLLIAMALLFSACHRPCISCRSEYLYPCYLASQQMNTPDPKRECFLGQQILISWKINKNSFKDPVTLLLHIRYGNRELATFSRILKNSYGICSYILLNEEFNKKCGILSYRVELLQNEQMIGNWKHFLWADILKTQLTHFFSCQEELQQPICCPSLLEQLTRS